MPYDLFISYSRRDNVNSRVTELKEQIETDYLEFAKEPLNCFFDQEEIKGMDDWQHRLLQGLKDSHLLLIILSPNYLASPYCEWEIVEYLKYEYSRGVAGDGVAQVYFIEIPGIDDEGFRAKVAQWLEKVSRRQRIDLHHWYDEGVDSLKRLDVKKRLNELKESLRKRITRMRIISEVPGNLPAPNPRFVGREREMEMLHKATALGQLGVITAVHGVGGLGKTAIAFQYAYAYANFYPGGRWYLGCANETNLASVIKRLDADLNITLTEDEKKDDIRGAKRILNELFNRAVENAEKANGKSNNTGTINESIKPAVLLILDNVDHPELIQPPCSDIISGKEWLKIIATTRMGPEELGEDETTQKLLTIDELPFDDGVSLIESYQPGGRFKNAEAKEKAGEIVKLLGGFTLAVEVAALYLYEKKGRVSCADFLEILKAKGADFAGENTKKQLSHTKLISATIAPTLDSLSPEETLILSYASLLPPDSIPLPWLKVLVVKEYPQLGEVEMAGIDNPWISTINHLLSLRLFQVVDMDGQIPRITRMHRLIGENVKIKLNDNIKRHQDDLTDSIKVRCNDLEQTWPQYQWEIMPIVGYAKSLLEIQDHKAAKLVRSLCQWLTAYDIGRYSEPILRTTIQYLEKYPSDDYKDMSVTLSNLGWALGDLDRFKEAETVLRRALEIDESVKEIDKHAVAIRCNQLGNCLTSQGRFLEAEPFIRRAYILMEQDLGLENSQTLVAMDNLAELLHRNGDFENAESLFRKALIGFEKVLGLNHPYTMKSMQFLASFLKERGATIEAESLYRRALNANETVLGEESYDTLVSVNNLALFLQDMGRFAEAEPLFRRSMEGRKKVCGYIHSNTANGVAGYAMILVRMNLYSDSETFAREAIEIWRQIASDDPRIGKAYWVLGTVAAHQGNKAFAKQYLEKAFQLLVELHGSKHSWVAEVKIELDKL